MQLNSIDKYIKDKVQGYKPEYQDELWKGIEEKLPASRVPNGRGSWMLTAAAIVTIAILSPFIIKFYNITGNRPELPTVHSDSGTKGNNKSTDNPKIANAAIDKSDAIITKQTRQGVAITGRGNYFVHTSHRNIKEYAQINGSGPNGNGLEFNSAGLKSDIIVSETPGEIVSGNKIQRELMTNIFPSNLNLRNNDQSEISYENNNRYPDRKNRHPMDNTKWNDWQSIFYPFWKNPAYTGAEGNVSITTDFKTDNISEPNSRYTYSDIGAEYYSRELGLGMGLFRLSELSPFSLQSTFGLALSKTVLQMGSTSIKLGVSGTAINNNIFFNELNYSDQINPKFGFVNATSEKDIAGTTHALGLNGGLWISNPHVLAGLDVTNYNRPKPGFGSDATPLPRVWRGMFGYRFAVSSDLQFMPMTILTRENKINQANLMLTAVFRDKYMLAVSYQAIDPTSGWGNPYIYGAVNIVKKIRVFASYGTDVQLAQMGVNETFIHCGIKYQVIR